MTGGRSLRAKAATALGLALFVACTGGGSPPADEATAELSSVTVHYISGANLAVSSRSTRYMDELWIAEEE